MDGSRAERKERTRQAILRAALRRLEDRGFAALSLRSVARDVGIVPTAFYRHFPDMDELGMALVTESFASLRVMIRAARQESMAPGDAIGRSVRVVVRHVHEHREHFRFIARERFGGVAALRRAIGWELRLIVSELATDLGRFPYLERWSADDLRMLAELMVNAMISITDAVHSLPPGQPEAEAEIIGTAEKQLRLIVLGVPHWRGAPRDGGAPRPAAD
jgi:AcrR family transcriptional regulator